MNWLKRFFCRHNWEERYRGNLGLNLNGDFIDLTCKKCGKVKSSFFKQRYID